VRSKDVIATKVTTSEKAHSGSGDMFTFTSPALMSHGGRLWVAWTGTDRRLNIMSSADGSNFDRKFVLDERSSAQPALAVHNGRLVIGWTGGGKEVNVATLNV
jgi:hypothetical protein